MRPSIRLAALTHLRPIYVFTHDSIGLGEDGPTHQPIEQLVGLRAIPGMIVLRPADANEVTEAYRIENGRLSHPVKGAMLIGNGPTDLRRISMVGNDLKLDTGIGTCGKNGQGVPVGVGQPSLRMDRITVGGTG